MNSGFVDLSHPISDGMRTYPGLPGPAIGDFLTRDQSASHYSGDTRFQIGHIDMVANTGTYIDAPFHRFEHGVDIAGLPLHVIANLQGICIPVAGRCIDVDQLEQFPVEGRAVLLRSGWSKHWGSTQYENDYPFLSAAAADWLVARNAVLVGIDSLNIDDNQDGERPAHTRLLKAGIPIVEHLRGLEELPQEGFRFFSVPCPVRGMGSFPVRAFALLATGTDSDNRVPA